MAGRSTTTEGGIPWTSLRLRAIGAGQKTRSSGPAPETLTPIERARAVTIEVARKQAGRVVAAATVGPRNATTCSAKHRIGRGADKRASASKTFNVAAVIDGAVEDLAVVASVAAAGSGVDDNN
jgi:adenosylcobinamide amidohydrolase